MTPAQQAKEFAANHDIVIRPVGRRYAIFGPNGEHINEVGGYPAALNSMRDWVETMKTSDPAPATVETLESVIDGQHRKIMQSMGRTVPDERCTHFDDFDAAAQDRIRKAAKRIAKQRRRAKRTTKHALLSGPWRIIDGTGKLVDENGYPSRTEAISDIRRAFNFPAFADICRKAGYRVEYRPS